MQITILYIVYKRERFELTGKWETTIGAPEDFDLALGFSEDVNSFILRASETGVGGGEKQHLKQLKKAEQGAICYCLFLASFPCVLHLKPSWPFDHLVKDRPSTLLWSIRPFLWLNDREMNGGR